MNKDTGKLLIKNNQGQELECDVLFTFDDEDTAKSYVIFTDNSLDDKGNIKVFANTFNPEDENSALGEITTEKEWQIIENLLASLQEKVEEIDGENKDATGEKKV